MDDACYGRVGGLCLDLFLGLFGHVSDVYPSSWLFCKSWSSSRTSLPTLSPVFGNMIVPFTDG